MPCRDDRDDDCSGLHQRINELEGMLCEAIALAEDQFGNHEVFRAALNRRDPRLLKWYLEHEAQEEAKVRREAAAKLSKRELRLLGIDENGNNIHRGGKAR